MLIWCLVFLLVAIVSGVLGFSGVAAGAMVIAKIIFVVTVVLFLVSMLVSFLQRP